MKESLPCYADGIPHEAHDWDFGSEDTYRCAGSPLEEIGCDDECPKGCEADHPGES